VSVSYPLPCTKFHELVKAQLRGKTHWQDSNDLAMMFRGTYNSEFYRSVRNLLHEQVILQSVDPDWHAAEHQRLKLELERRWQELLMQEQRFRSQYQHAAAV
jgi:anaerobic magnesium-protoporphyrin IX monomethyl ester cyclase